MRYIVALSGGKDSTAMALRLAEVEPRNYEFVITPTGRELPAMSAHWKNLESLLGKPLFRIPAPSLVELIVKRRALPNWRMRWCTPDIKIKPFMSYVSAAIPAVTYVGIRADEVPEGGGERHGNTDDTPGIFPELPLVRWGWGIARVRSYLQDRGIEIPVRTDCDWCFFQRLIEWYELWRDHRDLWAEGEAVEFYTGHTFRSAQRDSWPASMLDLRAEFERGRIPADTRNKTRQAMCSWCAR